MSAARITRATSSRKTFQLWQFFHLFGLDMHHLVFIQRESNEDALTNLRRNLRESIKARDVTRYSRIYTEDDIINIQKSSLDVLQLFKHTNDSVEFWVASGSIKVELRDEAQDESEWFEGVFESTKFPRWKKLGGHVIDMEEENYELQS
ncbi:hypothetical protein F5884DRAFT_348579 [Xylogone sp. PMI_703]|nr:hypothetical protein F5884DRAFT_348579 [Xylogone sp. PMI_703]